MALSMLAPIEQKNPLCFSAQSEYGKATEYLTVLSPALASHHALAVILFPTKFSKHNFYGML